MGEMSHTKGKLHTYEQFEKWVMDNYEEYEEREIHHAKAGWQARQPEIDAIKAEVERLRKDSDRYRFLRLEAYESVIPNGNRINGKRTAWITKLHPGDSFDSAIDTAMKETK